jgi:predicted RNase H-like nuclease (RuvC/YqgF family)
MKQWKATGEGKWKEEIQVKVEKRVWWKLWLGKATSYKTEYKTRSSDNGKLPSIEELLAGWSLQAKKEEPEIANQIVKWLLEQIDCLEQNVSQAQNHIIDRYQSRLDRANQELTLDYERQRNVWEPMQNKAKTLAEEFASLGNILKEDV